MKRTRSRIGLATVASVALVVPALAAAAPPTVQITDAGGGVAGLSTADEIAGELLAPGVSLAAPAKINGSTDAAAYGAALPAFGRFTGGTDDIGIDQGLIIGANARAGAFAEMSTQPRIATDRADGELFGVVAAANLCTVSAAACVHSATSLELSVVPTGRYLKFEYALAITEDGGWTGTGWDGNVFGYPDGFALFVGGRQVADNCAVVPRTPTYVTMQTAGVVPPADAGTNRALAQANLAARVADTATPPTTPTGFAYATQNPDWAVRFLTVPLTCVADVQDEFEAGTPADIKIVVADVGDDWVPPAVLLRGDSVRFSDDDTPSAPAPASEPTPAPAPTPAPETPAPGSASPTPAPPVRTPAPSPVVTPLAPPIVHVPGTGRGHAGPDDVLMVHRLRFDALGRYTFIYVDTATGRRIPQLPGSTVGSRTLAGRFSAPVLRNVEAGRRVVLSTRFDPMRFPRDARRVALRIVHRAPDGTLSAVTIDGLGAVARERASG